MKTEDFLDFRHTIAIDFLTRWDHVAFAIPNIRTAIEELSKRLRSGYRVLKPGVLVGEEVEIAPSAVIEGPAIIGAGTEIRHNAYIRKNVIIGNNCVIGNASEIKNSILFDKAMVPHFNYVGDSILGYRAHLGAGAILSNFRADGHEIHVQLPNGSKLATGSNKFGSIVGDGVEIGCNTVCFPGAIIGSHSMVYPLTRVRGFVPPEHILKSEGDLIPMK